ncbi:hypothetical protein D9M71_667130 [compost metagenome]
MSRAIPLSDRGLDGYRSAPPILRKRANHSGFKEASADVKPLDGCLTAVKPMLYRWSSAIDRFSIKNPVKTML